MSQLSWIIALIPAIPLLGFLINILFIRDEKQAGAIATGAVALAFAVVVASVAILAGEQGEHPRLAIMLWEWISVGSFRVPFGFVFDQLTAVMALLITGVGGLIHYYSIGYMHGDVRPVRYFAYLNLFVSMMLVLVMADNMLLLFLGWEGVGLCSFLLIGHWFERNSVQPGIVPSLAAVKAFVANRIGDAALLLAMAAIFSRMGSLTFFPNEALGLPGFLNRAEELGFTNLDLGVFGTFGLTAAIALLMLVAVTGKSAQAPLFVWLPDAMAGPTPVSALIHAATMVTAGVYLVVRNHPIFTTSGGVAGWVVGIGVFTAFLAATAAATQFDIKRVLAYSTISQLGYMVAVVGLGGYVAGMFHLLTHGLFKALLFLGAGAIIHATHETQDMRKMGGLRDKMPTIFWTYMVGSAALAGLFPLAGFWSKDEIIAHALFSAQNVGVVIFLLMTSAMTAFYVGRSAALIFWGNQRDKEYHAHDVAGPMRMPLIILAGLTVIGGLINLPGLHFLSTFLHPVLEEREVVFDTGRIIGQVFLGVIATAISVGAGYGGWYLYAKTFASRIRVGQPDPMVRYLGDIWNGAEIGWGFDWFYNRVIIRPYREFSQFLSDIFDREGIDGTLVRGPGRVVAAVAQALRVAQSGYIRSYALMFLLGVVVLLGLFVLRS
jgi:NADH-quinone oxidoreductase subunit L